MKLTTKTRYSLRILVQLALNENKQALKGKEIASKQKISEPYLEQIMIPLKTSSFVKTIRGCNGGYTLNKSPETITVLDILELFEGKIEFSDCLNEKYKCSIFSTCPTSPIWRKLSNALADEARKITLQNIIEEYQNSNIQEYVI
ncbi:MAG TPA: Rrf2 family transcriptional regulator [Victivallales bacterium]|nr:Rrf2 family transcriptional regulator [Victivallales bacterium]